MLVIAIYLAAWHTSEELKLRRLLTNGIEVTATAVRVKGVTASDNPRYGVQRDQTIPVEFSARPCAPRAGPRRCSR